MGRRYLGIAVLALAASLSLGGCFTERITDKIGGELNGEEFADRFAEIDDEVDSAFAHLINLVQTSPANKPLADTVRDAAEAAIEAEGNAVSELEDINPPDDAEDAVDQLIDAADEQAAAAAAVLADPEATATDLIEALQENDSSPAVDELRDLGYAPAN